MQMIIKDLAQYLDAEVLFGEHLIENSVESACGSDLMSDVLAFVKEKTVLITGLVNTHVIRTAEMLDITCIVFSRGKVPGTDVIAMAADLDIAVLTTKHTMYVACGILYAQGLPGTVRADRMES